MEYLNLELLFNRIGRKYRVQIVDSPHGQASVEFKNPFSADELNEFFSIFGRIGTRTKQAIPQQVDAAKNFGAKLFETVFIKDIRGCFQGSLVLANNEGKGLRIRLRLKETPELADLPWEFLYNPGLNRFLSLYDQTPIVRSLDMPEPVRPLNVNLPLKILVMISCPKDLPELNAKLELKKLRSALSNLVKNGLVSIDYIENSTLNAITRKFEDNQYHIFHYIGHGAFDTEAQDGILVLEKDKGLSCLIHAEQLGMLMHGSTNLRLVILNACEGARTSTKNPFAGTAQSLIQQGIPAVIAMQFEISDNGAIMFSEEFYSKLSEGNPVDEALSQTRLMMNIKRNDIEWGIPALYMRSSDGHIFNIKPSSPEKIVKPQPAKRKKNSLFWISIISILLISVISILLLNTLKVKSTQIELQVEVGEFSFRANENWHIYSLEAEQVNISNLENLMIDVLSVEQKIDSSRETSESTAWSPIESVGKLILRGTRPDWGVTIESKYLNLTSLDIDSGVLVRILRDDLKRNNLRLRFSDGHVIGSINTGDSLTLIADSFQIGDGLSNDTEVSKRLRILPFDNQIGFRDLDESLQIQITLSRVGSQAADIDLFELVPVQSITFTTLKGERIESTILNDALIYFRELDNKKLIGHKADFILINGLNEFEIKKLELVDNLLITLAGKACDLRTGPKAFIRSQMPSYLEWLYANQFMALLSTILILALLIIFLISSLLKNIKNKGQSYEKDNPKN